MPVDPTLVLASVVSVVKFAEMIAQSIGMSTADLLKAAAADVAAKAADPSDETDPLARDIDNNLPGG